MMGRIVKCQITPYWIYWRPLFVSFCLNLLIFSYSQIAIAELKIYYMHGGPSFRDQNLWVMNADGSNKKLFMKLPIPMIGPRISPDGKRILFNTQSPQIGGEPDPKLMTINFDGSDLRELLANPPRNVRFLVGMWSPDGKHIVYKFHGVKRPFMDKIFITDAQGMNSFQVASELEQPWKYNFSWFPDSQRIAFAASSEIAGKLYMVNATPEAKAKPMDIQLWDASRIVWSLDGKRTIVTGRTNAQERNELFLGDGMGRNLIRLTRDNDDQGGAEWLPDGRHIVYTTHSEQPMDVVIMDVETKEVTRLTKDGQSSFAFWYDDSMVFSVNPLGKLSTSWGAIKSQFLRTQKR